MKKYTDKEFKSFAMLTILLWKEHERQIDKWGIQTHTLFEWLTYTTEELGELAKAISTFEYASPNGDKPFCKKDIVKEAIQVATLCLKIAEMIDEHIENNEEEIKIYGYTLVELFNIINYAKSKGYEKNA